MGKKTKTETCNCAAGSAQQDSPAPFWGDPTACARGCGLVSAHTDTWCEIQEVLFPQMGSTFQEWTKRNLFPLTPHQAVEGTCGQGEPEGTAAHLLRACLGWLGRAQELSTHSHPAAGWL